MSETGTGSAASTPTYSLGDEVGTLLGEGSWDEAGESGSSDAADAPSAERQDDSAGAAPGSEGQEAAERAGDPPADAAPTEPDASGAPSTTADEDYLAGAVPLSYVVDGQQRQFDGIMVLKDNAGAIVTPEALQLLTRRIGERDHLYEQDAARAKRYSDLEKLTEWRTKGQDGKDVVMTGSQGIEMRELATSMLRAEVSELRSMFDQPPQRWLATDDAGNIVWNTQAFQEWNRALDQSRKIAYHEARSNFQRTTQQVQAPAPPPTSLSSDQISELAPKAVTFAAEQGNVKNLTPDSIAFLTELAPRYLRVATTEDVQANPQLKVGQPVVDQSFLPIVQRQAAQQAQTARVVTTAQDAAKANAAKLAQAALGNRAKAKAAPAPVPTRDQEQASRSQDLWAMNERAASRRRA